MLISLIGTLAGLLTTLAYVPQVMKVLRSRSAGDISLQMYMVMVTGTALWLVYGILIHDWPVTLANGVSLLLTLTILIAKLRYG